MTDMKNAKNKAKALYDQWRQESICCPAFNGERVVFSLKGWNHITGATGHKKRSFTDVRRRLKLLPHAREIIERSSTIQNVSMKRGVKFFALEAIIEGEKTSLDYQKIRVVICEDRTGKKIFYSVMDKKQNSTGNKKGTPHA